MSWSSSLRAVVLAVALAAPVLAGCSGLRPVYGTGGAVDGRLALNYADPASRLDQIIIQDLSLRLGKGGGLDAPLVRISTASGSRDLTRTAVARPVTQKEMAVTAVYSVVAPDGRVLLNGQRKATAQYSTSGQVLADEAAAKDASERAARAVAETIRLSILSQLATPVRETVAGQ